MAMATCVRENDVNGGEDGRKGRLAKKRIGFTTPAHYEARVRHVLDAEGATCVWAPSLCIRTCSTTRLIREALSHSSSPPPSGIAFTSRAAGIRAIHEALLHDPHLFLPHRGRFFLAALGRDADLVLDLDLDLDLFGVRSSRNSIQLIVPSQEATPKAMVEELGFGHGRSVLCPVPSVEGGLEEPHVVPEFLAHLVEKGWDPLRINAYTTSWMGPRCALPLLPLSALDALVLTSTAEVEGLLKSLHALKVPLAESMPVIAAHGPVTAAGATRLGLQPQVVSTNSSSFHGIVDALDLYWRSK